MNELTTVNNNSIIIKEYNGQRVVTFKDIDEVHDRPFGTAKRNFKENRENLIENTDFYKINLKDENRTLGISIPNRGIIVFTQTGYLMLVKSFNDEKAWKVQRQLVNTYFKAKEVLSTPQGIDTTAYTLMQQNKFILQTLSNQQEQNNRHQEQMMILMNTITSQFPQAYKPPFTRWMSRTYEKIDMLADNANLTRKQMLCSLYNEFQDTYDIDLNEYQYEYCTQHNIENTGIYTMNTIGASEKLRDLFNLLINTQLEQIQSTKPVTSME